MLLSCFRRALARLRPLASDQPFGPRLDHLFGVGLALAKLLLETRRAAFHLFELPLVVFKALHIVRADAADDLLFQRGLLLFIGGGAALLGQLQQRFKTRLFVRNCSASET